jgi:hypothetical protein
MVLVLYLLLGWSLGWLVARSVILEPMRALLWRVDQATAEWASYPARHERLVGGIIHYVAAFLVGVAYCAACSGFWLGLGLAIAGESRGTPSPLPIFAHGLVTMGVNALADAVLAGFLGLAGKANDHGD